MFSKREVGPWHVRACHKSRAFYAPKNWRQKLWLLIMGWRPYHGGLKGWWSKSSDDLRTKWKNKGKR